MMHFVPFEMTQTIMATIKNIGNFGYDNHRDNVLIIGQFHCAEYFTVGNNVTIISDNLSYNCAGAELIRVNDFTKEYKEVLNNMRDKHFDLIIANPPYAKVGAEITKFIVDSIDYDEFINLLPANDYTRVKGLINHVDMTSLKKVESGFEDAAVDTWVARVVKKHMPITEESFTLFTYDEKLRNCYEEFANRKHYAIDGVVVSVNYHHYDGITVDNTFAITRRTNQDGVHYKSYQNALMGTINSKTAFDVKWNLLESVTLSDVHIDPYDMTTVDFIKFNTAEEKKNK